MFILCETLIRMLVTPISRIQVTGFMYVYAINFTEFLKSQDTMFFGNLSLSNNFPFDSLV